VVYTKGQYNHLITRRLRELGVESELMPASTPFDEILSMGASGLVMGGGPQSVRSLGSLSGELKYASNIISRVQLPMLCICVTHQLLATTFGGRTALATKPEYGPVDISVVEEGRILDGLRPSFSAWESHNDEVVSLPAGFRVLARSENCAIQAMRHEKRDVYGVQFHPEVYHTPKGVDVFKNFLSVLKK